MKRTNLFTPILTAGILAVLAVNILVGCARTHGNNNDTRYLTGEATQAVVVEGNAFSSAIREASLEAEKDARDRIMEQALRITTTDGQTLGQVSLNRPEVHAILLDLVRSAPVVNRTVDRDAPSVSITVRMPTAPLREYLNALNEA